MNRATVDALPFLQRRRVARKRRAGVTAIDAVAGVVLSAVVAVTAAQLAGRGHRSASQRTARAIAVLEAENVLQRARAADARQLEQMATAELDISQSARAWLSGGRVDLQLEDEPADAEARVQRLVVNVSWGSGRESHAIKRVEVVGWRVLPAGAAESTGGTP